MATKTTKPPVMKFNTGLKKIPLEFTDRDETVYIFINPTEKNLPIKLKKLEENIRTRIDKYSHIELGADGKPENTDFLDEYEEMTNIIYEELNTAFASDISSVVFKYCHPLSIVNGNYYFMTFIEQLIPVVEYYAEAEKEAEKKANERVNKYVDKYGKYIKK